MFKLKHSLLIAFAILSFFPPALSLKPQLITSSRKAIFVDIDPSVQNIIQITGSTGTATIEVSFTPSMPSVIFDCIPSAMTWCVLPRRSNMSDIVYATMAVDVACRHADDCDISASLISANDLVYDRAGKPVQIYMAKDIGEVNFKVPGWSLFHNATSNKDKRLRFTTRASLLDAYIPCYFISNTGYHMQISYRHANQPISSATPISRNTTELDDVLMSTIYHDDDDFCHDDKCSYIVNIRTSGINIAAFTLDILDIVTTMTISDDRLSYRRMRTFDQTFSDHTAMYMCVVHRPADIMFELIDMHGNPDIYINIDDSNDYIVDNYYYMSDNYARESIVINKQDIIDAPGGGKVIYVVVKSKSASAHILTVTWGHKSLADNSMPIKLNSFYSGALHDREVASFVIEFKPQVIEQVSGLAKLKAVAGNPDLYIKDCETEESCYFTIEEIDELTRRCQNKTISDDMYFIYSKDPVKNDQLYFDITIKPVGYDKSLPDSDDIEKPTDDIRYASKVNMICVGVVGNKNSFSQVSQYSLVVSSKGNHKVISEYQTEIFYIQASDVQYCVFKPLNLPDQAKGIIIQFEVSAGDVEFYYSRLSRYPNDLINDVELTVDNPQTSYESTLRRFKVDKDDLNNDGVYFGFLAAMYAMVKVEVVYWMPTSQFKDGIIELIPNAPVVRNIKQASDFTQPSAESDTFTFKTTGSRDHIFIKMRPLLSGSYHDLSFCAFKSYDRISINIDHASCVYHGQGGMRAIEPSTDDRDAFWYVIVKHIQADRIEQLMINYEITLMGMESVRPLKRLGMPEDFIIPGRQSHRENLHYIEFVSQSTKGSYYLLAHSLNEQHFRIQMSFDQNALNGSDGDYNSDGYLNSAGVFTVIFKEEEFRKHCEPMKDNNTSDNDAKIRILQNGYNSDEGVSNIDDVVKHGEVSMPLKCRGFIKVTNSLFLIDQALPYRLLFTEVRTKIELLAGKSYKLPKPGKTPIYIKSPVSSLKDGATIMVSGVFEPSKITASVVSANPKSSVDT